MVEFRNVSVGYGGAPVLRRVSFSVPEGSVTTLVGPNGCGKTTLLRAAANQLPLLEGEILVRGRPVRSYERREFARTAAYMPQVRAVPAITVGALVAHGRFPYLGFSRRLRAQDRQAVEEAMQAAGIAGWAGRDLRELSGGERQRVYIAMALAQGTGLILLDEPTTYLDLHRQFELLELVRSLNRQGKTIVMVLHDLAHALRYSDHLALLDGGGLVQFATPAELLHGGKLESVFRVLPHETADGCYFTPLGG